ncbi:DoxX family protein [Chloroherpeton thalassium ATCC 35110]|uniref:DoxX family protein n=1 Tax=Chloroherpeton thalassium (strain ATCC 35110 / GB-78) TaxID=517418 RepID=B3QTS0_CHLT3|nr:DoxX-like family protein [Chloroherpeton thalassium]ACF14268.1 DoxX family protein [Chloroherpeton thalassium ATCC 35110]
METINAQNDARAALQQVHIWARIGAAFVWIYHGLVPKLLFGHVDEIRLLQAGGIDFATAKSVLPIIGVAEILIGVLLLLTWSRSWPLALSAIAMIFALLGVAFTSPAYLVAAFNPVSLNLATFTLSAIGFYALHKHTNHKTYPKASP